MWRFYKAEYIKKNIQERLFLAQWMGFFNHYYDCSTNRFARSNILSICNICLLVVSACLTAYALKTVWSNPLIHLSDQAAEMQGKIVYGMNFLQLALGVLSAYCNHAIHQDTMCHIMNNLIKCNRRLMRLIKRDTVFPLKKFRDFSKARVFTAIIDVCLALQRDRFLKDWPYRGVLLINVLSLLALFFEWNFVQHQLSSTYEILDRLVSNRHASLSEKDYRAISKICSRVHRIQCRSRVYFKQFAITTYLSLIRTIGTSYIGFSILLFGFNRKLFLALLYLLHKVLICGFAPVVEILMLGIIAECLIVESNKFRWNILMIECTSRKEPQVQKAIDLIMLQEHWEDINWAPLPGASLNRQNAFDMILEVVSWSLVMIMYDAGRLLPSLVSFTDTKEDEMWTKQESMWIVFYLVVIGFVCKQLHSMLESVRKLIYLFLYLYFCFVAFLIKWN